VPGAIVCIRIRRFAEVLDMIAHRAHRKARIHQLVAMLRQRRQEISAA
jgi:hypothetical protein